VEVFLLFSSASRIRHPGGLSPVWGYCGLVSLANLVLCVLALCRERRLGRRVLALWCLGGTLATLCVLGGIYYEYQSYDRTLGF
jgi:hypothetical protein